MVITLGPELESALNEHARKRGIDAEVLALDILREQFLSPVMQPRDEWERRLLEAASDCGTSLSHEAVSCEGLY
jgi:hypothetical protein